MSAGEDFRLCDCWHLAPERLFDVPLPNCDLLVWSDIVQNARQPSK